MLNDDGDISTYLGVDINKINESSCELLQPFLIDRILKNVGIDLEHIKTRETPVGKPLL